MECARCRLMFTGRRTLRLVWCPVDRCYLCGQCYRESCQPVHGTAPATRGMAVLAGFAALVVFGSGILPLALAAILEAPTPASPTDNRPIGFGVLAILGIAAIALGLLAVSRRLRHRRKIRGHPAGPPGEFAEVSDPSLEWRPNRAPPPRRVQTLLAAFVAVAGADVAIIVWMTLSGSPSFVLSTIGFVAILSMVASVVGFLALLPFGVPSSVAVAADGIHFRYASAQDQRTQVPLIKWEQLNILGLASRGTGDPADRLVRYLRIDAENAMDIYTGWQRHRIDPSRPRVAVPPRVAEVPPTRPTPPGPPATTVGLSDAISIGEQWRGTMCARCHVRFPGFHRFRLLWCRVDHFYVCRRCWEVGCAQGHGRGVRSISKPAPILAAALVVSLGLAVWYPGVVYDHSVLGAWHDAPPRNVVDLRAGELVKVAGMMRSLRIIALGGHEVYYSKSGWWWTFNTSDAFDLVDRTGTIPVTTSLLYFIYNGPHYAPYAVHTQGTVYVSGDPAVIVGTVALQSDGTKELEAKVLASQQTSLGPSDVVEGLMLAIPVAIGVIVIAVSFLFVARWRRHGQAVEGVAPMPLGSVDIGKEPELEWKPNRKRTRPRRPGRAFALALVGTGIVLGIFPGYGPRAWDGYWIVGFYATVALMCEALVLVILITVPSRPSQVAVGETGFRLWYDSPYDRLLNDSIFPWEEIQDIHLTRGRAPHWVLQWTTGEVDNLSMLSGENLHRLLEEWTRRAMPPGN